jgi:hypothetical protein
MAAIGKSVRSVPILEPLDGVRNTSLAGCFLAGGMLTDAAGGTAFGTPHHQHWLGFALLKRRRPGRRA